jgi:hypothetical protein
MLIQYCIAICCVDAESEYRCRVDTVLMLYRCLKLDAGSDFNTASIQLQIRHQYSINTASIQHQHGINTASTRHQYSIDSDLNY